MALEVWWIGKKEGYPQIEDYLKRLNKYTRVSSVKFKDSNRKEVSERKKEEGAAILNKLKSDDHLILLDENGKSFTSVKWARKINDEWSRHKRTVFLIGGAYGVDSFIKDRANETLRLSDLTFPHEIARLVLVEQIYRAYTILNGEKYHHS